MLAPGKLEHVFTILNSTWKRVNEALDATQSWNELRCPSQSCNARCSPQRSQEHQFWQFLLAVTTAPQKLTTWANARCQEFLWLAQDHLAWRLRGSPTPWTELLEGRHHCSSRQYVVSGGSLEWDACTKGSVRFSVRQWWCLGLDST